MLCILSIQFRAGVSLVKPCVPFVKPKKSISSMSLFSLKTSSTRSSKQTSLVFLKKSIRIHDNPCLIEAAKLGPDGLTIATSLPPKPTTPSTAFQAAAAHALNSELSNLNQTLVALPASTASEECAALMSLITSLNPTSIVIDSFTLPPDTLNHLQSLPIPLTMIPSNSLLHDPSTTRFSLGRTRSGGKVLRWSTYLTNRLHDPIPLPLDSPSSLPPPPQC